MDHPEETLETLIPVADEGELLACVEDAAANGLPLEVSGRHTRSGLGRPVECGRRLDLSGMAGITMYEPDELVLTARAATPLATILAELGKAGQMLAFDPMLGADEPKSAKGTIGGVLATNLSGPRRLTAGAARDYLLGFKAVSGRGGAFQSGSRVMKNVTGYDLSKLMAGSYGTLAVMHEVTLKTMPRPETSASLLYRADSADAARTIIEAVFAGPHEPSAAAIIPAALAVYSRLQPIRDMDGPGVVAVVRLEGFEASVKARRDALASMPNTGRETGRDSGPGPEVVGDGLSDALQAEIRETSLLPRQSNRAIWKITCPPAEGGRLLDRLLERPSCRGYADWGGGLVWLQAPSGQQAGAEAIRSLAGEHGGEAMLFEADEGLRRTLAVFHPQTEALAALTKRIKGAFDPLGILNPGRMFEGV